MTLRELLYPWCNQLKRQSFSHTSKKNCGLVCILMQVYNLNNQYIFPLWLSCLIVIMIHLVYGINIHIFSTHTVYNPQYSFLSSLILIAPWKAQQESLCVPLCSLNLLLTGWGMHIDAIPVCVTDAPDGLTGQRDKAFSSSKAMQIGSVTLGIHFLKHI